MRESALDRVRLDRARDDLLLLGLQILELDEPVIVDRARQRVDEPLLCADVRRRRLREVERTERLLELRAHAVERRVRAGRDHRPDELECEADRTRLERGQPRRPPERVAEELLVDVHLVALQLGVHRVTAAAEVDEVEQREVLFELLGGNREPVDQVLRRDHALALVAARGQQVGEQRLQDAEPLRSDRAGEALADRLGDARLREAGRGRGRALVRDPGSAGALDRRAVAARTAAAVRHVRPAAGSSARAGSTTRIPS